MSAKQKPAAAPDPGPRATQAQAKSARDEALALLLALVPLNLPRAAEEVERRQPSAAGVAFLAFIAHDVLTRAEARRRALLPRKRKSMIERVRKAGLTRYADAREKAPELHDEFTRAQLTRAISKAKRR